MLERRGRSNSRRAIDKVGKCKKRLYDYYTEKEEIHYESFSFFGIHEIVKEIPMRTIDYSVLSISQDGDDTVNEVGK